MEYNKTKNEDKKYSRFVYVSAMRYALVVIIFIGGSFAFFGLMINNVLQGEKAPSAKEIAQETADLLQTYPEFEDWERLSDHGIALWLPQTFEQFKIKDVLDMASGDIRDVPYPLRLNIDVYGRVPGTLHFLAFDQSTYGTEYIRHIQIISIPGRRDMLDDFVGGLATESSDTSVVQPPTDFQIGRYSGKFFITETEVGFGFSFATVSYFIPQNGQFYTIVMQTSGNQIDESQEIMNKMLNTVWIYNE